MDKHEILKEIVELIDLQDKAINQHPAKVAVVYFGGRNAFIKGQHDADLSDCKYWIPAFAGMTVWVKRE